MAQGFIITEKGQKLIAQYAATKPSDIVITRVMVGSGELTEDDNPEQFDNLVQPVAQASSTIPMVKNNIISFIVEYRNDMNGGLKEGFWLREFGVFARDGEQEILLYYATLEAYPQYVDAYQNNKICVKKYPVSIAITGGIKDNTKVKLEYSPAAFVTEERMKEFTENETLPYLQQALQNSDSMIQKALESKADAKTVAAQLAQKANSVDVSTALSEKANSTDMTEELNKKANKTDMQIALSEKANAQEVQQALNQKSDAETMTTELEKKADEMEMLEELAKKANKNDMVAELAKKADKDDMQKELDQKADLVQVEELLGQTMDESSILMELDKKANKTDVQTELDKKADAETVQEELGKKADTEVVQQELDKKADSETVSAALALKADNETMTTELGKKANSSHNHSASDINSGTLPIARGGTGNTTGNAATATKLQTARTIDGMNFDGSANIVHFGVCSTAADVAAKTVTLAGFVLTEGARIAVFFTTNNTASNLTLNVNSTGAKPISCTKGSYAPTGEWEANQIVEFIYYSNHWIMITANARRLYTARTIRTNLGSTSSANFDGTANVAPGVTGTLPIANGGTGNTTGNATTATKLQTARTLALSGDVTGNTTFDGTANKTIAATLANSGVSAGTYGALDLMTKNNGTVWVSNNVGLHGTSAISTWTAKQACKVSFRWRVSSEANCDYLNITAAGTQVLANTGTPTEQTGTLTVTLLENQSIVFTYRKDGSVNSGMDRAEISEVKYGAGTADPNTVLYESNVENYFTIENGIYGFYPAIPIPSVTVDAKGRVTKGQTIYVSSEFKTKHANGTPKEGQNTTASGYAAHAEGMGTTASGDDSHAEGGRTVASNDYSHAEGSGTTASGDSSHAEGSDTTASGWRSHAEGWYTTASGNQSHAGGYYTKASANYQTAIGKCNKESAAETDKFIIGNGTSNTARSNCLRVTNTNGVYSNSTYKSSGADYAEYWEWADGNESKQDRIGLFVALEGDKIHIAQADDDIILGIVSACPSILGDTYDDTWKDMYLFDVYGRPILEEVEIPEKTEEVITTNENGEEVKEIIVIEPAHKEIQQKLNPDYDPTKEYIPRSERPEWAAVGMMGKLVAIDDGSCEVGGWCTAGDGGIATKSEQKTKFYVMKRIDENHIKVLIL